MLEGRKTAAAVPVCVPKKAALLGEGGTSVLRCVHRGKSTSWLEWGVGGNVPGDVLMRQHCLGGGKLLYWVVSTRGHQGPRHGGLQFRVVTTRKQHSLEHGVLQYWVVSRSG